MFPSYCLIILPPPSLALQQRNRDGNFENIYIRSILLFLACVVRESCSLPPSPHVSIRVGNLEKNNNARNKKSLPGWRGSHSLFPKKTDTMRTHIIIIIIIARTRYLHAALLDLVDLVDLLDLTDFPLLVKVTVAAMGSPFLFGDDDDVLPSSL